MVNQKVKDELMLKGFRYLTDMDEPGEELWHYGRKRIVYNSKTDRVEKEFDVGFCVGTMLYYSRT